MGLRQLAGKPLAINSQMLPSAGLVQAARLGLVDWVGMYGDDKKQHVGGML